VKKTFSKWEQGKTGKKRKIKRDLKLNGLNKRSKNNSKKGA
jgi:hypothetical protein